MAPKKLLKTFLPGSFFSGEGLKFERCFGPDQSCRMSDQQMLLCIYLKYKLHKDWTLFPAVFPGPRTVWGKHLVSNCRVNEDNKKSILPGHSSCFRSPFLLFYPLLTSVPCQTFHQATPFQLWEQVNKTKLNTLWAKALSLKW